jgi:AAA15 family ATPase/GTPase
MINQIKVKNFGPLTNLDWKKLGKINLVLGGNSAGKTFLLKALYSAMRTIEEYKRGDELKSASEILADKLYWTFQSDKIGELVTKGADGSLSFEMSFNDKNLIYRFDQTDFFSGKSYSSPRQQLDIFTSQGSVVFAPDYS